MNFYRAIKSFVTNPSLIVGVIHRFIQNRRANRPNGFDTEVELVKIPMTILGIWPFGKHQKIFFTITMSLCIILCLSSTKSFFSEWKNQGITQYLSTIFFFYTTIKPTIYRITVSQFQDILICMKENWRLRQYLTDDNKKIMSNYVKKSRYLITIWMIMIFTIAMVGLPLPWMTSSVIGEPLELHINTWFNPLLTESPSFELAMAWQFFLSQYAFLSFFCLESCFIIMIVHCCGQLRILSNTIQQIDGRILHDDPVRRYQCSCIKCIVESHWKIIRFHKAVQKFLTPVLCLNLIAALIFANMAVVMIYRPMTSDSILFVVVCGIYFIADIVGSFLYCTLGEMLIQESTNISDAVFNSKWYNLQSNDAKSCLIIMTYSQNVPMKLKFGLFYTCCHALFKDLIMLIYSFSNVARTMRDKKK